MILPNRLATPLPLAAPTALRAILPPLLLGLALSLLACGSSGGGGGGGGGRSVSFGVSDAPVEGLASVVITIDRITLERAGQPDVVIERFTSDEAGVIDADTITVDLLDFRGEDNLLIAGPLALDAGDYQNLRLAIIEEDVTASYVEETGGDIVPIKVPSGELKLGGFEVAQAGDQTFILEFGLRFAMTYNPGPDRYILKPRGVRIVEVEAGTTLEGVVDPLLFASQAPCDTKLDPTQGNVVYLYQGIGLDPTLLADSFDPALDPVAAASLTEPFAAETVAADGTYLFSYLPADDYTVAFSCDAIDDDPDLEDGIVVPAPDGQISEVTTLPGEDWACDFPVPATGCGLLTP